MGEALLQHAAVVVVVVVVGISGEFGRETINLQSPTHKSEMKVKEGSRIQMAQADGTQSCTKSPYNQPDKETS